MLEEEMSAPKNSLLEAPVSPTGNSQNQPRSWPLGDVPTSKWEHA